MRYLFYKVKKAISVLSDGSEVHISEYRDHLKIMINLSKTISDLIIWNRGDGSESEPLFILSPKISSKFLKLEIKGIRLDQIVGRNLSIGNLKGLIVWAERF